MKAIVYIEYGAPEVLKMKEVEKPIPKDNEVLVRVHASSINYGDIMARNFKNLPSSKFNMPLPLLLPTRIAFGLRKPKKTILGNEFSGEIEAVGNKVIKFKKGDQVFGYRGQSMGTYAEYVCLPEKRDIAIKPSNMSYEEAAAAPYGALMALSLLKKVSIQPGDKVLINGASGGIGTGAVQLAKALYGATVTGVCSTSRMEFVKALGVDKVIDYTKEDFTKNGETYDLILDILGKSSFSQCKNSLNKTGRYLLASFKLKQIVQMMWTKFFSHKKVKCALAIGKPDDLSYIKELIEEGKFKSIIDKSFPLEQAADAHRYIEEGHKKGQIVITMADNNNIIKNQEESK